MPTITELTAGAKPVETKYAREFYPYYDAFFKTRKNPRFYQSILEMSQYINVPLYYWKIIDDCLVFIHKRYIHQPVLYLVLPPISLNLNHNDEINVIEMFRGNGCHTRLSEEDMGLFGFDKNDVIQDKFNSEFIYLAGDSLNMPGKKWKNIRYESNNFNFLIKNGKINIKYSELMTLQFHKQCKEIYEAWLKIKGKRSVHSAHKVLLNCNPLMKNLIVLICDYSNNLIAWGASEKVGDKKIIQTTRFRNYENQTIADPTAIIHQRECLYWAKQMGNDTLCNLGSGVFEKLIKYKRRLNPIRILQLYNLKTEIKIQKTDWDNACKIEKGFNL